MPALHQLFDQMLANNASDLHLSVGYPPMIRSKGDLTALDYPVLTTDSMEYLLAGILDDERWQRYKREWDLDFAYGYEDKARFRVNYLYKTTGPGAVFRTIPSTVLTADQLGVPQACLDLSDKRSGLILVTGPTGSGKSTTLAAILDHVNRTRQAHILTIEDPVEFVHQPVKCQITHREVGLDTPSFAHAIRSAGRENADVILVGELRGAETMRLALQLASSGVLVFATVHTNSASATIERYVNAFPAQQQPQIRGLLSDSLAGIVAQQLLRRADGGGRVAAHEILVCNTGISAAIRESRTSMISSLIQSGRKEGMQTLDSCLKRLMEENTINALDALEKALNKESFMRIPAVERAAQAAGLAG